MKDLLVIVVLVIVALVGASRSAFFGNKTAQTDTNATSTPSVQSGATTSVKTNTNTSSGVNVTAHSSSVAATPSSALPIDDQPAGEMVVVSSVTFGSAGWVAVHDGVTGTPGNTIGATWLPKGTHTNVNVELVRPMIAGNQYFLILHSDDGDKKYNSKIDLPLDGAVPFSFRAK